MDEAVQELDIVYTQTATPADDKSSSGSSSSRGYRVLPFSAITDLDTIMDLHPQPQANNVITLFLKKTDVPMSAAPAEATEK